MKQRGWLKKKNNDWFWMENIFCLESHIHLCSRRTSANPAYVIKTCLVWHAFSGARYWGFVSPKLHVSTYRNQQHCWWFRKTQTTKQLKPWWKCYKIWDDKISWYQGLRIYHLVERGSCWWENELLLIHCPTCFGWFYTSALCNFIKWNDPWLSFCYLQLSGNNLF